MDRKQYLSLREAAEYLRLTVKGALYHVKAGHLPATLIGSAYVLLRTDVEEFRNKQSRGQFVR